MLKRLLTLGYRLFETLPVSNRNSILQLNSSLLETLSHNSTSHSFNLKLNLMYMGMILDMIFFQKFKALSASFEMDLSLYSFGAGIVHNRGVSGMTMRDSIHICSCWRINLMSGVGWEKNIELDSTTELRSHAKQAFGKTETQERQKEIG